MEGADPMSGCAGWSGRGQASHNSLLLADISLEGRQAALLYRVYDYYLQTFLDTYDDQADLLRRTDVCERD